MVLSAVCDARYCFSLIDIGKCGSNNDSGILKNSKMGKLFENGKMNVDSPKEISDDEMELPYFLVGD